MYLYLSKFFCEYAMMFLYIIVSAKNFFFFWIILFYDISITVNKLVFLV